MNRQTPNSVVVEYRWLYDRQIDFISNGQTHCSLTNEPTDMRFFFIKTLYPTVRN